MPNVELREAALGEARQRLAREGISVIEGKNLDNVMKDFLESTQEKVKNRKIEDTNILIVCCNGEIDMQLWRGYLFGEGGFFTEDSPVEHERFDDVDFVLLTNIYNRHFRYFNDLRVSNHWSLSSSFNLLYPNKYSRKNKATPATKSQSELKELNDIFFNHNIKFEQYLKQEDVPPGENVKLKYILGVAWYADKFKSDSVFYFNKTLSN